MSKFLCLFFMLLLLMSCTLKDFEAPEFDKKVKFPLTNEVYYLSDLADTTEDYMVYVGNDSMMFSIEDSFDTEYVDQENLRIDGQLETFDTKMKDELKLDSREETTDVNIGDDLRLESQEKQIEKSLNKIEVQESGNAYAKVEVLSFASEAINEPVDPIFGEVIPPFYEFEPFNQNFSLFENDNFEYVVIDTGSVYVNFFNNTQLPLSSNLGQDYQMHFEFYTNGTAEDDDGSYLFTHYIDHIIAPGETQDIVIPFNGKTVYMKNYLKCFLTTDGSIEPIDVSDNDSFDVTFRVGNMTISEANAEIKEANMEHVSGIPLDDDEFHVITANISSCEGSIRIENKLPFDIDTLELEFQELYTPRGNPLTLLIPNILANTEITLPLDIANHTINSSDGNPLDSLRINLTATTDPPSGYSIVNQNDLIFADIQFGEMDFEEVFGQINKISENLDKIDINDEDFEIVNAVVDHGIINFDFIGGDLQAPSLIEIQFDEIIDPYTREGLIIVFDDFDNTQYDLTNHEIYLDEDQLLHYNTKVHLNQRINVSKEEIVTAEVKIDEIYFDSVSGIFGNFEMDDFGATEIDSTGEFSLFYAEIHECDLKINIPQDTYPLPLGANLLLSFNDIYTPDGELYSLNFHCPGDTIIDLSGFSLGENPSSEVIIDSLRYSYIFTTDQSDEIININGDDILEASILIDDIVFEQVNGILDNKEIELNDINEEIDLEDLPDNLEGLLEFQAVELHLNVLNQTGFDCRLSMDISASNEEGEQVFLEVEEIITAASLSNIVITEGVNEMLNLIPNQIDITNIKAYVGDGNTSGYISLNDSISGNYCVVSPMQFIVNDHLITKSADKEELESDDQDIIEDNLEEVKFIVETKNSLPFGMELSMYIANDSLDIYTNPGLVIDSLQIAPATIDEGNIIPTTSQLEINLSKSDFDVFLNREKPQIFPGVEILVHGTNGQVVTIMGSDNLQVTGYLEAVIHIAEEEDK